MTNVSMGKGQCGQRSMRSKVNVRRQLPVASYILQMAKLGSISLYGSGRALLLELYYAGVSPDGAVLFCRVTSLSAIMCGGGGGGRVNVLEDVLRTCNQLLSHPGLSTWSMLV